MRSADLRRSLRATFASWIVAVTLAGCDEPARPSVEGDSGAPARDAGFALGDSGADASHVEVDAGALDAGSVDSGAGRDGVLLWLFDGETGRIGAASDRHDGARLGICSAHPDEALSVSRDHPRHSGELGARFFMREDWTWGRGLGCQPHIRTMVVAPEGLEMIEGESYWLGLAVLFPESQPIPTAGMHVVVIHPAPGVGPQIYVSIREGGTWRVSFKPGLGPTREFGTIERGVWTELAMRVVNAHDDRGRFALYRRLRGDPAWETIVEYEGPTMEPEAEHPSRPQIGMISGDEWNEAAPTRTLFFDEIRLGGERAILDDVAPGSGTTLD
jgi:hypothetical protein